MAQKNEIDPLVELAVFVHLDKKTDLELILLKGHLMLETILESVLRNNGIHEIDNYSFYRKISLLKQIDFDDELKKELIIYSLEEINRLRNKLAHEFDFDIANGEFEMCSNIILKKLKGNKFSKYTFRTKFVHSFSVLSKNLLAMKNYR